jgi:hypothetical protein
MEWSVFAIARRADGRLNDEGEWRIAAYHHVDVKPLPVAQPRPDGDQNGYDSDPLITLRAARSLDGNRG